MPANHNVPHTEEAKAKMRAARLGKPNLARRRETRVENGATLYRCGRCKEFLPADRFYKTKRTILGLTSECRKCHSRTSIKSRDKDRARDANREYMRRARDRSPTVFREREKANSRKRPRDERWRARYELNLAVHRGDLARPDRCEVCGGQVRVTAHHDDYAKPLEVRWLCYECHGKQHRNN